jgi:hypothetical protein
MLGVKLATYTLSRENVRRIHLDLNHIPAGRYMIVLQEGDKRQSKLLIKQ